jgi:hypothetical protein
LATVALLGVLVALQVVEFSFYQAEPSVWRKP